MYRISEYMSRLYCIQSHFSSIESYCMKIFPFVTQLNFLYIFFLVNRIRIAEVTKFLLAYVGKNTL